MTDSRSALDPCSGQEPPSIALMQALAEDWEDLAKTRKALQQRHGSAEHPAVMVLLDLEADAGRHLARTIRTHELFPWLRSVGFGDTGVHLPRLLAMIGTPHRFPGQRCSEGHYFPPRRPLGEPCPSTVVGESCPGTMLTPRTTTGVRSIKHWAGIAPGIKKQKGKQADFNPAVKGALLMPNLGIVAQLIRRKQEPYYPSYREFKERRAMESDGGDVSVRTIENLTPAFLDNKARRRMAGQFLGDLLMAWKAVA